MQSNNTDKIFLLGFNATTRAIAKALTLFGVEQCGPFDEYDLLLMVDGDEYEFDDFKNSLYDSGANKKILYVKRNTNNNIGNNSHPLSFLTEFFESYEITMENFSLVSLVETLCDIRNGRPELAKNKFKPQEIADNLKVAQALEKFPHLMMRAKKEVLSAVHFIKHTATINSSQSYPSFREQFYKDNSNSWFASQERLQTCFETLDLMQQKKFPVLLNLNTCFEHLQTVKKNFFDKHVNLPDSETEKNMLFEKMRECSSILESIWLQAADAETELHGEGNN